MKIRNTLFVCLILLSCRIFAAECPSWLNQNFNKLNSKEVVNLCSVAKDKPMLIVNTASKCGFTGQFADLEKLHKKYQSQGLVVVGFPSANFLNQEYSDGKKTAEVCYKNYGVTFLMVEKSNVKGKNVNAVFKHLNQVKGKPGWNFNKYLIDKNQFF